MHSFKVRLARLCIKDLFKFLHLTVLILFLLVTKVDAQFGTAPFEGMHSSFPAPTATSMSRVAEVQVNLYTGSPFTSIQLLSVENGKYNIPVSLNYNHGGIMVEEIPGWVGLGWSLNAGGVITRSVKGLPDDSYYGYLNTASDLACHLDQNCVGDPNYLWKASQSEKDPEPDVFYISMPGLSGQFIFDHEGNALLKSKDAVKISYETGNVTFKTNTGGVVNVVAIKKFTVINKEGTQFIFSDLEMTRNQTAYQQNVISTFPHVNAWHLTKIKPAASNGEVIFEYTEASSFLRKMMDTEERYQNLSGSTCNLTSSSINSSINMLQNSIWLKRIITSTEEINFESSLVTSGEGINERRLDKIEVRSLHNAQKPLKKAYHFSYSLYSNRVMLDSIYHSGSSTATQPFYLFDYNRSGSMPPRFSKSVDHWGYANNNSVNTLIPQECLEYADSTYCNSNYANRSPNFQGSQRGILKKVIYPTGGYTSFEYELHDYSKVRNEADESIDQPAGGVRVNKIVLHDGSSSDNDIIQTFSYNIENGRSSGVLAQRPGYAVIYQEDSDSYCRFINRTAKSIVPLRSGGTHIGYRQVEITYGAVGEYGSKRHYFTASDQYPDEQFLPSGSQTWRVYASMDHKRGLNTKTNIKNSSGQIVNKIEKEYNLQNSTTTLGRNVEFLVMKRFNVTDTWGNYVYLPVLTWYRSDWIAPTEVREYHRSGSTLNKMSAKEYEYDTSHLQLKEKKEINSNDEERIITYQYAHEQYSLMESMNMLTQPYSITKKNENGQVKSKQWTLWEKYHGYWHPCGIWKWDGGSVSPPTSCSSN